MLGASGAADSTDNPHVSRILPCGARETAARGVEGWLDFRLEDAHNVQATGPAVVGHAAIRECMTGFLADTTQFFTWEPLFAEVATDGSLGFTYGDWSTSDRLGDIEWPLSHRVEETRR